jgi:hypothetical protein
MNYQNSHTDDRDAATYLVTIDADTDEVVSEVALELEESFAADGETLPPLNEHVDLDLLSSLAGACDGATPMVASVSFDYCDREVLIERSTVAVADEDRLVMSVTPKPRLSS